MDEQEAHGESPRLLNAEEEHIRQQIRKYSHSVIPIIVLFFGLSLQPWSEDLSHLRWPGFLIGALVSICAVALRLAERSEKDELQGSVLWTEHLCLVMRIFIHIICIAFDGDSSFVFLKMVSLWWLPFGFPKACDAVQPFRSYLVLHNVLVLMRFWNDFAGGAAWMVSTVVMDKMLLDHAYQEHAQYEMRKELALAHAQLEGAAEVTTKRLFSRFCDATATLDADLRISEPAPQLAALLGLNENTMKDRVFTSLIDGADLQDFIDHMEIVSSQAHKRPDEREVLDYFKATLLDAFAKPVSVHIFHASFRGLDGRINYFMGMSETWRPPKTKSSKSSRSAGRGTSAASAPEGQLSERGSLFGSEVSSASDSPGGGTGGGRLGAMTSQRRAFSPRPSKTAAASSAAAPVIRGVDAFSGGVPPVMD
mmetsp:Transcript_142239/g.361180  ORF Transcript_142239/g.361180 Transcript_142239/m.361180 type:complete len:423 (-) Transcript_142239:144-1412(-)